MASDTLQYWDKTAETKPLSNLIGGLQTLMAKTDAFQRASKSSLYKQKWPQNLIQKGIRTFADLQQLPYTTAEEYSQAVIEHPHETLFCSNDIVIWYSTSGTSGEPKWYPQTPRDVETRKENRLRLNCLMNMKRDDRVFAIVAPPPFITSPGPAYFWKELRQQGYKIETLMTSYYDVEPAARFAIKRNPTVIAGLPALIARLGEAITEKAGGILTPKDVYPSLERGVLGGDFLNPCRKTVEDEFGIEAYDIFGMTESLFWGAECSAHNGIHMYVDQTVLEIIPEGELEREEKEEGYTPRAELIFEIRDGTTGELVFTEFADALPLVRYRTADLVRLVSLDECECGRTHPRIKILGRIGNIISLGPVRLSEHDADTAMKAVTQHGNIEKWQVRIGRVGYKPKAEFIVKAEAVKGEQALREEILQALCNQKKGLAEAVKLGVIEKPEIKIANDLKDATPSRTKIRRVFYDRDYAG